MLKKLTNRIYYMPNEERTDRPLLGLVIGDKYSMVIDSGNSEKHAKEFLKEVNKMDIPPLKYLFITHWHWDHVFGIAFMNLITICHEKTKEKIVEMKTLDWRDEALNKRVEDGEEIEFCSSMIKLELPTPLRDELIIGDVDITFKDEITIDLGGISCVIENIKGDHSEDSSIAYIPEEKVMFLGDAIYEDLYSGEWSYSTEKLFPMIHKIKDKKTEYYLPSHGPVESKEETLKLFDELITIGEFTGDEILFNKVIEKYIENFKKEPDEETAYYINSFVNGNKKRNNI
ncbi:MBL fold metallo-hydrolase [Clostridium sp. MSJ-11]|uniref:MBL fold metallo-hydrolase n=1 Tax=Clostridium mobile TaxID=2841512 RepID=A0ABS6EDX4_9CLOT|nr:MBL fold metallo-hydrolase [Clostridium mobile]MBU5483411.1 MBL fold metallo-hydrolase [Clostridium mobile]